MNPNALHADLADPVYNSWKIFLRETETWSWEQIQTHQLHELQRIVNHAWDHSPGYRKLFTSHGISPGIIKTLDDVRRLPYVDKETLRDCLDEFSVPMPDRTYVTTGGSSGIPFGMYRDPEAFSKELASKAYQYQRIGWQEGDRQLVLRGLPIETPDHMSFVPEFNELRCSSYHLTPECMEMYREKVFEYQPHWLRCYPSSGCLFAQWLKESGRSFPTLKGVLCASENLYDFQKHLLSEVFKARVFSHYGHYELAVLAGFCEHTDDYHVLPQYGYAELIAVDGQPVMKPGQMGEIVGTSFIMHATPMIRYRTNDYAILKGWQCPHCGRPYQTWEHIEGRLQEFLLSGTGRHISMTAINFHDDIFDRLVQFQFHQRIPGQVTFQYIPKSTCNENALADMRRRLQAKLGEDMKLTLSVVDDIPLTQRGKHRFLIQELPLTIGDR